MIEATDDERTIPVIQEAIIVERRAIETDRVRVRTVIDVKDIDVLAQVAREKLVVERRQVEREVAEAPAPVEDGEMLIISVVEERAVVEKRLFVIEELVIRRIGHIQDVQIPTTLKTMRAVVEQDSDRSS